MQTRQRLTLPEAGAAVSLSRLAGIVGVSVRSLHDLFSVSSERLRRQLRLRGDPFSLASRTVRTGGIAGIVRLAQTVELEIAPKCFNPERPDWHSDFLLLASVAKLGRIYRREHVTASLSPSNANVVSLMGAVFLYEFERLIRVPIREYRRSTWRSPIFEGEPEYAEIWDARPEGYLQSGPVFSATNDFMGTIVEAATYLGNTSADRGLGQRLIRLASAFPNPVSGRTHNRVPGRHARWQYLYDLAVAVTSGFGLHFGPSGALLAPGFVLNTERSWEDLLAITLTAQGSALRAQVKPPSRLGVRHPGGGAFLTYPDIVLRPPGFGESIVVDAKYKGTASKPIDRISADDLYQALAFLTAQGCNTAILVFPWVGPPSDSAPGDLIQFDEVYVDCRRVVGVSVTTDGISGRRGLAKFGNRFGRSLLEIAAR